MPPVLPKQTTALIVFSVWPTAFFIENEKTTHKSPPVSSPGRGKSIQVFSSGAMFCSRTVASVSFDPSQANLTEHCHISSHGRHKAALFNNLEQKRGPDRQEPLF